MFIWRGAEGHKVLVNLMTDTHICYTLRMLVKTFNNEVYIERPKPVWNREHWSEEYLREAFNEILREFMKRRRHQLNIPWNIVDDMERISKYYSKRLMKRKYENILRRKP